MSKQQLFTTFEFLPFSTYLGKGHEVSDFNSLALRHIAVITMDVSIVNLEATHAHHTIAPFARCT